MGARQVDNKDSDSEHYELERLNRMEADAEAALTHIREMRREYINRNNLNRELKNEN